MEVWRYPVSVDQCYTMRKEASRQDRDGIKTCRYPIDRFLSATSETLEGGGKNIDSGNVAEYLNGFSCVFFLDPRSGFRSVASARRGA